MTDGDQVTGSGSCNSLNFLSISSHRRTSFTNFRWNALTSGFSWKKGVMIRLLGWHTGTHISKLHETQFTHFGDTGVSRLRLQEQLTEGHFLGAEQGAHLVVDQEIQWLRPWLPMSPKGRVGVMGGSGKNQYSPRQRRRSGGADAAAAETSYVRISFPRSCKQGHYALAMLFFPPQ